MFWLICVTVNIQNVLLWLECRWCHWSMPSSITLCSTRTHTSIRCRLKSFTACAFHCETCYGDVAVWLGGWVSVTRQYCIKTAKPILKVFRPSGSAIILVSYDPCADTQFQGGPLQRGRKIHRGGKNWQFSCDFRRKSPFISESVRHRPMVTMER